MRLSVTCVTYASSAIKFSKLKAKKEKELSMENSVKFET